MTPLFTKRSVLALFGEQPTPCPLMAMMPIQERSEPSLANMWGIGRVDISTTGLSRTIAASRADVDRCLD
jgi:hypothetical protein